MTGLSVSHIEALLHEHEGTALDFKRDQYRFDGAGKEEKSELLKDILAFANSWRRSTAYILIGVNENPGGRGQVVGISDHLDDAKLQQFVNSKTNRTVTFSYRTYPLKGKKIGVIEIPIQERPIYLTSNFGKLEKEKVYIRRGSSTTDANPDEIVGMGRSLSEAGPPKLSLEWADLKNRKVIPSPCELKTVLLDPKLPENTFDRNLPPGNYDRIDPYSELFNYNHEYSREIIDYTYWTNFLGRLGFRLRNEGETAAKRVRFVGTVKRREGAVIKDWEGRLTRPHRERKRSLTNGIDPKQLGNGPESIVNNFEDHWEITVEFGNIRPHDDEWTKTPILVGEVNGGSIVIDGELRGDNISSPISCRLEASFAVECRPMEKADVQKCM